VTVPASESGGRPPRHGAAAWLRLAVGCLITLALGYFLFSRIDLDALLAQLRQASAGTLLLACGSICIAFAIRIIRWWQMLRVSRPILHAGACVAPYMISIAFNNLLPFRLGDFYRIVGFSRQLQISSSTIFASVVVERLIDLAVLLAVLLVSLATWLGDSVPEAYVDLAYLLAALVVAVLALLPLFISLGNRILQRTMPAGRLVAVARDIEAAARRYYAPRLAVRLLGLTVLAWSFEGAAYGIVIAGNSGYLSLGETASVLAAATLSTLIPSSPGYVGTFHYAATVTMEAAGMGRDAATATAILIHGVLWITTTAIGLLCWFSYLYRSAHCPAATHE
jgi:uncharacterized protein (TIRG00374 family)